MASKIAVTLAVQGQAPKAMLVNSGATLRSVLNVAKLEADKLAGAVTIDGDAAGLSDRVKSGAYIAVTPKVAGGR